MGTIRNLLGCLLTLFFVSNTLEAAPPKQIPRKLRKQYTLDGQIPVVSIYLDNSYPSDKPLVYTEAEVNTLVQKALRLENSYYGATDSYLYAAIEKFHLLFEGKDVAVMGSVTPWYEAITLSKKGNPYIIEYNKIISQDPRIKAYTVAEYEKEPRTFDVVLSISSFEHDGLGRYGDPLDPFGDVKAMNNTKKMLKPEGILIMAVPVGPDTLCWNAHRIYGQVRLPLLLAGWEVVDSFGFSSNDYENNEYRNGCHQPVFVLKPS